jgi:DegV family protein with EDD domain
VSVAVITDSASSLPREDLERLGISVVTLHVSEDGRSSPETDLDLRDLYERLPGMSVLPSTSQPSPAEFVDAFAGAVDRGGDVLAVLLSSKMSGTFRSAETAAAMIRERHAGACIELVDSESNSMQEGFAVLAAGECAKDGGDLAQCAAAARATIKRTRFLFAPASLEHLHRRGRSRAHVHEGSCAHRRPYAGGRQPLRHQASCGARDRRRRGSRPIRS